MANAEGEGRGQEAIAADKRLEAFQLRCDGLSFTEIGARLSVSRQTAYNYVNAIMEELHAETVAIGRKYVERELKILDGMLQSLEAKAKDGDIAAQEMTLKILARRTKYLGLDMPDETKHSGEIGLKDLILQSMAKPDGKKETEET